MSITVQYKNTGLEVLHTPRHIPDELALCSAKESMLYVGRVAATLRGRDKALPRELVRELRTEIMGIESHDREELDHAIARARAEVGE